MSVLNKEQILARLKERIGEDTSDETLQFIEDVSDTINDLETRTKNTDDWKKKYEDNDKQWRQKYRDRFFNSPAKDEEPAQELTDEIDDESIKNLKYEDLFKTKEETK